MVISDDEFKTSGKVCDGTEMMQPYLNGQPIQIILFLFLSFLQNYLNNSLYILYCILYTIILLKR